MKWPFQRSKLWHELGDDAPSVINELKSRKHWKSLPQSVIQRFTANATYVFDRPIAAADALKRLVFLLELRQFQGRLQQIASTTDWTGEVSRLSLNLFSLASEGEQSVSTAQNRIDYERALFLADSAVTASLVCDRYALTSYTMLARLSLNFGQNRREAALWCDRYRKAEIDLLAEDESNLDIHTRSVRECLDPEKARQTAEEMRRVLPKHLLEKYVPDFDSAECLTPRELVERIEDLIGIQQAT